eukprot:1734319-Karenia_brevis.AAC.1
MHDFEHYIGQTAGGDDHEDDANDHDCNSLCSRCPAPGTVAENALQLDPASPQGCCCAESLANSSNSETQDPGIPCHPRI